MNFFSVIKESLQGADGGQSSKRLFTFILMLLWVTYFISNLFWGYVLKDTFEEQLFYMILVFFAGITLEGWKDVFSKKKDEPPKQP